MHQHSVAGVTRNDASVCADPASRGYSSVVRMGAGVKRSQEKVFCGGSGWAFVACSASTGQFRLGAPASSQRLVNPAIDQSYEDRAT